MVITVAFMVLGTASVQAQEQDSVAVKRVSLIADDLGISREQAEAVVAVIDAEAVKASEARREAAQALAAKLSVFAAARGRALKELLTEEQLIKVNTSLSRDFNRPPTIFAPTRIQ